MAATTAPATVGINVVRRFFDGTKDAPALQYAIERGDNGVGTLVVVDPRPLAAFGAEWRAITDDGVKAQVRDGIADATLTY